MLKKTSKMTLFLISLVLAVLIYPFIGEFQVGGLIESVVLTVVLLFAVQAVGDSKKILTWASLLVLVPLAGKWLNFFRPDLVPREFFLVGGLLFISFVISRLFLFVLRASRVNWDVMCCGISIYILLALLWYFVYEMIWMHTPEAFSFTIGPAETHTMKGFEGLYYSFMALCASSYGAIIPISKVARLASVLEQTVGMFYITILIARLVGLYTAEGEVEAIESDNPPNQSE